MFWLLCFYWILFCSLLADANEGRTVLQAKLPECDIKIGSECDWSDSDSSRIAREWEGESGDSSNDEADGEDDDAHDE